MRRSPARKIAMMGLLLALSIALSYLESLVPALPGLPPGVKLGLSNVVTMYGLFFMGPAWAAVIVFVKSGFVLLLRGVLAGAYSLSGGALALLTMALLNWFNQKKPRLSAAIVSVCGAVAHNMGQLLASSLFLSTPLVWYYAPVLLISGVVMGLLTGYVLKLVSPALKRLGKPNDK